jgi:uncharacterized protein (TIGR02231 family)
MAVLVLAVLIVLSTKSMNAAPPEGKEPVAKEAPAPARAPTTPAAANIASSRVVAVTIYPNSALVTREVDIPAGPGMMELTVAPLPSTAVGGSLYTEASNGIRVLATRFRTRPILEDSREDVRKLQDELKQLQQLQERTASDIRSAQANLMLLSKMESFSNVPTMHAADKATLNSDSAIALSKHVMEQRIEKSREQVKLQQEMQTLQEKTDFTRRKLSELTSNLAKSEQDAVIVIEKNNPAASKVRLNYLVESASWRPQYKLRAGKGVKDAVQVEYLAALVQHTGEDWSNVQMVLSTAQPTLNAAPPDLQVLQVTVQPRTNTPAASHNPGLMAIQEQSKTLRTQAQKDLNDKHAAKGAGLVNSAAALDQSWELLNPDAAVRRGCLLSFQEGPSVTYHLGTRLTLPSRNDEQVIEVARIDLQPEYYYKAVPVLTSHVYRLADLTNKSKYVLLPGEATMYIDSDFVGQMNLPLVAIGEQFTAGFGVDPQLQVQRQMTDRSRTTQGGNQVLRYEYRILVSSYKSEKVKMQVWDRLPHPETDAVGVSLIKAAPETSKDPLYQREQQPSNLLRWDVSVDPAMSGEKALAIQYEFRLELDRQMTIGSFQTKLGNAAPPMAAPTPAAPTPAPNAANSEAEQIKKALSALGAEDRKLAETQIFCAIDQDSPLGSMGPIFKVMVKGRPVFLCCKGCVKEANAHPDQTLALLDKLMAKQKGGKSSK